jgi:hypothetical protein
LEPHGQAARLDELLRHAGEATERLAAKNAEHEVSAVYAARINREAHAEPEPSLQTQAQSQVEAEP